MKRSSAPADAPRVNIGSNTAHLHSLTAVRVPPITACFEEGGRGRTFRTGPRRAFTLIELSGESFVLVVVEPGVDAVGIAVFGQAGAGHGIGGLFVSDLEEGGTAFA